MTETIFDHDRLDVYGRAVEYTVEAFPVSVLTRMAIKRDGVAEGPVGYGVAVDYQSRSTACGLCRSAQEFLSISFLIRVATSSGLPWAIR